MIHKGKIEYSRIRSFFFIIIDRVRQYRETQGEKKEREGEGMIKFGKTVVKFRIPILILSFLLLIPAGISYINTRINYDILSYLPGDIDTMKGQDILLEDFGTGAFSLCVVEDMSEKQVVDLENEIKGVEHVKDVIWYDTLADISIPMDVLPSEIKDAFNNEDKNATLMIVTFDTSMSADETLDAIEQLRTLTKQQCFMSGMSAVVTDIKKICNSEAIAYVILAAGLSAVVLALTMDSFLVPVFFLLSIGMAIIYNLGTNFVSGEISFITQALAAVLQLAVTMDYSIFLWHSYQENQERFPGDKKRAMAHAISNTVSSVVASSVTTVAGFVAMCFMTFTLGLDLGIVMAKGVVLGVLCCVTVLPAMILTFDGALEKTRHRALIPKFDKMGTFATRKFPIFLVLFVVILIPAVYGYRNTNVYYDLAGTLPADLESVQANNKLEEDFNMGATHIILASSDLSHKDASNMIDEINDLDGVAVALGKDAILGPAVPQEMLPADVKDMLDNGKLQMIYVMSEYKTASDEVNAQCDAIKEIIKRYDPTAMLIGEAPCTEDLITITDKDFKTVSAVSIILVFLIIAISLKSISIPVILVAVIEFGIFINMGIPHYTGSVLPFIASIVIGTIQLGATVDYAILTTNKYKRARNSGAGKQEAIETAMHSCLPSVFVSALSFFAATFGVGVYSSIDMISSLCILLARGAIISFFVVAFILPAMFMVFDRVIIKTSMGFTVKK